MHAILYFAMTVMDHPSHSKPWGSHRPRPPAAGCESS